MMVSHMWEEDEGRTSGMAIENFAWIRACVKAGLSDDLITQISKNGSQRKEWKLHVVIEGKRVSQCVFSRRCIW